MYKDKFNIPSHILQLWKVDEFEICYMKPAYNK